MLGRYNMHNLTVGEYSDAMTFIRNYWWNFQESPKYKEICDDILGSKDDTFIVKTRQVGMTQFLISLGVWLTIKSEKHPIRIAYYTPNKGLSTELNENFVDLMDSIDCDFKYTKKNKKCIRLTNGTTIIFLSNPLEFRGHAPFDYIIFDEVDFVKKSDDFQNTVTGTYHNDTKVIFCSSLSKDEESFYHYMFKDEEQKEKVIYFNWFDVPGRRKGLRLVNKEGLTHPNVILTEDSKIDHDLYLALLKAGWILTSDWREDFKKSGIEYADEEIDCVSQQERNEIPWLCNQENNETNEEKEENMFKTNLLDGVFTPEIREAIEQLTNQVYNLYNGKDTVTTSSTSLKYNNFQYTNNNGEEKCEYHFQDTDNNNKDYCMLLGDYIGNPEHCTAQYCKGYECEIPTMGEIEELIDNRPVCHKHQACTCGHHTSMPGTNGQTAKIGMNSCVNHNKDTKAAFAKASNELLNEAENKSKEMMKPTSDGYKDVMDAYKEAKQENKEDFKLNENEIHEAKYQPVKEQYKKMYENHLKKRGLTDEDVHRRHNIDINDYISMGKRLFGENFGIIEKSKYEQIKEEFGNVSQGAPIIEEKGDPVVYDTPLKECHEKSDENVRNWKETEGMDGSFKNNGKTKLDLNPCKALMDRLNEIDNEKSCQRHKCNIPRGDRQYEELADKLSRAIVNMIDFCMAH